MRYSSHVSAKSVLYGKYLVQDQDSNIYKCTTATIKNNNLYAQLFSAQEVILLPLFLTHTVLLMVDVRQQSEFFIRTV